jgi:hypothetical protein
MIMSGIFDAPYVSVKKISGYRLTPKRRNAGYISVDGEKVPFEHFQVEVHKGLGTVLSRSGYRHEGKGVALGICPKLGTSLARIYLLAVAYISLAPCAISSIQP